MFKTISDFMQSQVQNGLLLVEAGTGSGKTYQSCQAIYLYSHNLQNLNNQNGRKIYFTTTLLKNLPADELKKTYENHHNANFEKEVLVIKSNMDFLKDNLPKAQVPAEYQNEEFKNLKSLVDEVNGKAFFSARSIYKEEIIERLDTQERTFRKYLRKIISDKITGTEEEKKEKLRKDKHYSWIGKIYPTIFMDDYKIYLLSVKKLLGRNDTLIKPSYPFISSEILKNAIIFVDEFDATKETIQENIVDSAVDTQNDYLDLMKELHGKLHNYTPAKDFYGPYEKYAANKPNLHTLESLKKEADSIYEKYSLGFDYKTDGDNLKMPREFLFFDGTFRSYLKDSRHYIRTVSDKNERQVRIYFETKEEYEAKRNISTDINIYSLLREISVFLNSFVRFIANWAKRYAEAENAKRKAKSEFYETFTFENAVSTICNEYLKNEKLNKTLQNMISSSARRNRQKTESNIDDISFYNKGFKFFEFIDSDNHNEETKINFIQLNETPEKIMLFMAKNAKIIGLSATAKINSVLSNYSLDYLKDELQESFLSLSDSACKSLEEQQNEKSKAYAEKNISVKVESVDRNCENNSFEERLYSIAGDKDIARNMSALLKALDLPQNSKDYCKNRYCNIFTSIKNFIENEDIKSFLCLNMALPKKDNPPLDLGLFEKFTEQYCEVHHKAFPEIRVLKSGDDFDDEKGKLLFELSAGRKIFVFSSYKTVGAGQNLQYAIPEDEKTISLNAANPKLEKDFDAIYLGDVTNVITNVNNIQQFNLKELLNFLFETKYLYENNEISPKDLQKLVETGFKAYSKIPDYCEPMDSERNSSSARKKITRDVIQAVGRLCRTNNKKKNIYIYTNNALLSSLDVGCVKAELMPQELKELFRYAGAYASPLPDEKILIENEACRKSENANSYIKSMLQRNWSERSMRLWKELRICCLKYPTVDKEKSKEKQTIKKFYIQNYKNKSDYYFAQKGDFSDIKVNLFEDFSAFRKEVDSDYKIGHVSEASAWLQEFFRYDGMKEHFEKSGYAAEFGHGNLILSPALFNNIYKGALGEVSGKFILEKELNTSLKEIKNPEHFEFFDFALAEGIYIDFKHWKKAIVKDKDSILKEIADKLDSIGGKKAYIINILKPKENGSVITQSYDGRIIEVPYLIDENGKANREAIKMLIGDLHNGK